MRGQNLHLQGVAESLQSALKRAQKEKEEGQRSEARLRGELASRERQIRSLEFDVFRARMTVDFDARHTSPAEILAPAASTAS